MSNLIIESRIYRLTGLTTSYTSDPTSPTAFKLNLPRFEAGIQLCL